MRRLALLLALVAVILLSSRASAHSELIAAEPAPGARLAESPAEIRLTFSEPVAASSQIVVMGENFQQVEGLVPQFNPEQPQVVYTPLPPLAEGVYTVQWVAASNDGHEISGSYSFSVTSAASGSTTNAVTPAPMVAENPPTPRSAWWLGVIGILAVGLPLAFLGLRRVARRGDS